MAKLGLRTSTVLNATVRVAGSLLPSHLGDVGAERAKPVLICERTVRGIGCPLWIVVRRMIRLDVERDDEAVGTGSGVHIADHRSSGGGVERRDAQPLSVSLEGGVSRACARSPSDGQGGPLR